jgi:hypothetical protein
MRAQWQAFVGRVVVSVAATDPAAAATVAAGLPLLEEQAFATGVLPPPGMSALTRAW